MSLFTQIPISELRPQLSKLKRSVQLGRQRLVITCYGEIIGFLVPLRDISPESGFPEVETEEMPLTKFRDQVHDAWERLQSGVDCLKLTFHNRPVVAFVSINLVSHLPIPLTNSEDANRILSQIHKSQVSGGVNAKV
jgi:hypothetical protein